MRKLHRLRQHIVTLVLLTCIFSAVAWLLEMHPQRWDLTLAGEYTLSDQTKKILQQLSGDVQMLAFFQTDQAGRDAAAFLLDAYAYACKKIDYRIVDPDREPLLAQKYGVKGYGQLVIRYGDRQELLSFITEQDITGALAKLIHKSQRSIYFLIGHGERNIDNFAPDGYSRLKHILEEQNCRVTTLDLINDGKVPDDAAAVVIAGPQRPLLAREEAALDRYLKDQGSVLVLSDPSQDDILNSFLKKKNIEIEPDIIIDKRSKVLGADYLMPAITKFSSHAITKDSTTAVIFSEARSVRAVKGTPWIATELAWTSDESWAETDLQQALKQNSAAFDEASDLRGPVSVAVVSMKISDALTRPGGGLGADPRALQMAAARGGAFRRSYVVVIGDSDFAKNALLDLGGNSDLIVNAINFIARSPELIDIRPKSNRTRPLILTFNQAKWLFWYSFALVPGVILSSGIVVFLWKRRHR